MTTFIRRVLISGVVATFVAGFGYVLGTQVGNAIADKQRDDYRIARNLQTRQILEHMETISIGDTLPDYSFEDLDCHEYRLSDLVHSTALITFFDYECENCNEELIAINDVIRDSLDAERFIVLSAENPLHLIRLRSDRGIKAHILYDEGRRYTAALSVWAYPFSVLVDSALVVHNIVAGVMSAEELRDIRDNSINW